MGVGLGVSHGYTMEICHGDIANKMGISLAFAGCVDFRVTVPNSLIGAFKKTKKKVSYGYISTIESARWCPSLLAKGDIKKTWSWRLSRFVYQPTNRTGGHHIVVFIRVIPKKW
jgi:hypothetical protein